MNIKEFFATDYVDHSSYDNLRKIASYTDGLKNSSRKVLHTVLKKNITKDTKVSRLKSTVSEYTEYLHGEDNLAGVIVKMARRYTGTNNLPLLKDEGNFGKRLINEASADRYIFTAGENYLSKIYMKDDYPVLIDQNFEGVNIEPRFFVPILPVLLINGSVGGISTGFSQNIYQRPLGEIIKATQDYIESGTFKAPKPNWRGFTGQITQGADSKKWLVYGKFERVSTTQIKITELPIGYELKNYIAILDTLEDSGVISTYVDRSGSEKFSFTLKVTRKFSSLSDEKIFEALKLKVKIWEQFTCIGEDNRIHQLESAEELFYAYAKVREEYYIKRKENLILTLKDNLRELASKYLFIKGVIDAKIIVNNKKKSDIITQIQPIQGIIEVDDSFDYLLRMPIYSLTKEKLDELTAKIKETQVELKAVEIKDEKTMWKDDIGALLVRN